MTEVVRTRTVEATAGQIWEVLADYGAISAWAPNVSHSSLTTDVAKGVGATRRVQVGCNALLEEVIDWQPEVTLAYKFTGLPKVVRSAENRWRLVDRGDHVEVILTSTVDAGPRPTQKLIARIVGRQLAKGSDQLLDGLTTRAEGADNG